jgi:hypothetical protein
MDYFSTEVGEVDDWEIGGIIHFVRDHLGPVHGGCKQRGMIVGVLAFVDGRGSGAGTEWVSILRGILRHGLGLRIAIRIDGGLVVLIGVRISSCLALDLFIAVKTVYPSSPLGKPGLRWRWAMG